MYRVQLPKGWSISVFEGIGVTLPKETYIFDKRGHKRFTFTYAGLVALPRFEIEKYLGQYRVWDYQTNRAVYQPKDSDADKRIETIDTAAFREANETYKLLDPSLWVKYANCLRNPFEYLGSRTAYSERRESVSWCLCWDWLRDRYPEYENHLAYWS